MTELHSYNPIQLTPSLTIFPKIDEVSIDDAETKEIPTIGRERINVVIARKALNISVPGLTAAHIQSLESERKSVLLNLLNQTATPRTIDTGIIQTRGHITQVSLPYTELIQGIPVALTPTQIRMVAVSYT